MKIWIEYKWMKVCSASFWLGNHWTLYVIATYLSYITSAKTIASYFPLGLPLSYFGLDNYKITVYSEGVIIGLWFTLMSIALTLKILISNRIFKEFSKENTIDRAFNDKKYAKKIFERDLSSETFESIAQHILRSENYAYIFNFDINYWDDWYNFHYANNGATTEDCKYKVNHCSRMLNLTSQRSSALNFNSMFIRIFIFSECQADAHRETLKAISSTHEGTYQIINKLFIMNKVNNIVNFGIEYMECIKTMFYVHPNNITDGYFFIKYNTKKSKDPIFGCFNNNTSEYKKIIESASSYIQDSYDLRTINYQETINKIFDNPENINSIKNNLNVGNPYMLTHKYMKSISDAFTNENQTQV